MKISRTVGYAIKASLHLAQTPSQTPVSCGQLARAGQMPERFLLQILRSLVNHGILTSSRGAEGGFTLNRDPDDISLLDLVEAIEGRLEGPSPTGLEFPDGAEHKLSEALVRVTESMRQELQRVNLSQLIRPPGGLE